VFENLTTYKNRNGGIWGRGELHLFKNIKFADNAIGYTHASGAFGRYEYYDYRHDIVNTTFRNYEDNATRKTGAISHLLYTSFGASSNNAIKNVKFIDAKPVHYPQMERKWGNDNAAGSVAYKTAAFKDRDGSLGLGPNAYVVIHDGVNDSIAVDTEACQIKRDWNAAVCKGDGGRMSFSNGRGYGFGGIAAGPATQAELPPVKLSRKGGKEFSIAVGTNIRGNTEMKAVTERTSMDLHVLELDAGSWVILEIPGFTKAASGTQQSSLDALRKANVTSYYQAPDALWVKIVSSGDDERGGHGGGDRVQVSR